MRFEGRRHRRPGPGSGSAPILAAALLAALLGVALPGGAGASRVVGAGSYAPGAAAAPAAGWLTFHGSENRSGFTFESGPATAHLRLDVEPTGQPIRVGPVVAGGFVYAADSLATVFSVNLTSGSVAWRTPLGTTPGDPDLAGGLLVLGGSDGYVTALSPANGSPVWSRALDGAVAPAVAVVNGTVIAATSAGSLYALSLADGAVDWRVALGSPVVGGVAVAAGEAVVATAAGELTAVGLDGATAWSVPVGAPVNATPAIFAGRVVVGDLVGNVSAYDLSNGTRDWRFAGRSLAAADTVTATPAVGLGSVFVASSLGEIYALNLTDGALRWSRATGSAGYPVLASPALTPTGLYVSDAVQEVLDLVPANGSVLWRDSLSFTPSYSSPAVAGGGLFLGDDLGALFEYAPPGGPATYPVTGQVRNATGAAIGSAAVQTAGGATATAADGSFALSLANGSYLLNVSAPGFVAQNVPVTVDGAPVALAPIVLASVPTVWVTGRVIDLHALTGLAGAGVTAIGAFGVTASATSGPDGGFALRVPVGPAYVTVAAPSGYRGLTTTIEVGPNGTSGVVLGLEAVALGALADQHPYDALAPILAVAASAVAIGVWSATRARIAAGLGPRLLSRFGRYVLMRSILIVVQMIGGMFILFLFGSILPAVAYGVSPCTFYPAGGCLAASASWSNPVAVARAFFEGFGGFVYNLFTLNWGIASYGNLREPATTFLAWWFPASLELALFALPIAAGLAYLIGLRAGARPEGGVDLGARLSSVAALLVPSFLVVLLFLGTFYEGFLGAFGDSPYGLLPSPEWFVAHGGPPRWIGLGSNTSPTGLPILDGAIHGDWGFVELVLLKTLWQALAIAVVYVAIFLRFVRHAVVEAHTEPHVRAERARGIDERTILWRHTGRRVIPLFLLVFGMTLPVYIGTQSLVESMANDSGVGTLLIAEMTQVSGIGFGYSGINPSQHIGNFYQVTIFLLLALVLIGNLFADLLAHYFDPRLDRAEET